MNVWRQNIIDLLSNALRFTAMACLMIDGILLSCFTVWFCIRFLHNFMAYLNRVLFNHNW
jgi:hypothetical protein